MAELLEWLARQLVDGGRRDGLTVGRIGQLARDLADRELGLGRLALTSVHEVILVGFHSHFLEPQERIEDRIGGLSLHGDHPHLISTGRNLKDARMQLGGRSAHALAGPSEGIARHHRIPTPVLEHVNTESADKAKAALEGAGATVTVK